MEARRKKASPVELAWRLDTWQQSTMWWEWGL